MPSSDPAEMFEKAFQREGWKPWPFQKETWDRQLAGRSGLVNVNTGAGKTLAAAMATITEMAAEKNLRGLRMIWLTPLRALARDTEKALLLPIERLGLSVTVGLRTGDTSSSQRAKQRKELPNILITTPESLTLLLTYSDGAERLQHVTTVILDEWHELMGSKRGSQSELALARLRRISPRLRTWALSATIKNLPEAAQCAVGAENGYSIVTARLKRDLEIRSILPAEVDGFPWAGHLGLHLLDGVIESLDPTQSTLIFTNTRAAAERWFYALLDARPDWADRLALHHGSLASNDRDAVEAGLKLGFLKIVVATSSLDLGVDFPTVERVYQIGSPKSVARLLQRAGRSNHRPLEPGRLFLFPPTRSSSLRSPRRDGPSRMGSSKRGLPLRHRWMFWPNTLLRAPLAAAFAGMNF